MVGFGVFVSVFVFVEETGCFRQINKAVETHGNFEFLSYFFSFPIFLISDLEYLWWKPVMFD